MFLSAGEEHLRSGAGSLCERDGVTAAPSTGATGCRSGKGGAVIPCAGRHICRISLCIIQGMVPGEDKAWDVLARSDPQEVCARARVSFDRASGLYVVKSFGKEFSLAPAERTMESLSPGGEIILRRLAYFFRLSVLTYLNVAKDIPMTGRLVRPSNMTGAATFFTGSHVLPLEAVAAKYGADTEGFIRKGLEFGGERGDLADASLRLFAFPRIPVEVLLWARDDEFPARADLLLDSSCELQLPLDIIWSITMMGLLVLF